MNINPTFATTATDAEMATGFSNTASYIDAGRAADKADTIVQYLTRAAEICRAADALTHEDFTSLANGIADLVSEASAIRDRIEETVR